MVRDKKRALVVKLKICGSGEDQLRSEQSGILICQTFGCRVKDSAETVLEAPRVLLVIIAVLLVDYSSPLLFLLVDYSRFL